MYPSVGEDAEIGSGIMEETFSDFDDLIDLEPTPLADVIHQQHIWHHHQQQHNHPHHQQHNNPHRQHQLQPFGFVDHQQFGRPGDAADFFDECGLFASNGSNHRHKRRRSYRRGVFFSSELSTHSNPREIDEILTSWYTVCSCCLVSLLAAFMHMTFSFLINSFSCKTLLPYFYVSWG